MTATLPELTTEAADTDQTAAPTLPGPARGAARFAPIWKATAVRRITAAVIADHDVDGTRRRLVVPAERVAIAHAAYRAFNAPFSADTVTCQYGAAPVELADAVPAALRLTAERFDITGRCDIRIQVPAPKYSGADVTTAAVWASVDALLEAADVPVTDAALRQLTADVTDRLKAAGVGAMASPAAPGFGIHDAGTGRFTHPFDDAPRFGIVVAHKLGATTDTLTGVGTLPSTPAPADPVQAAAWLSAANGPLASPLAAVLAELLERPEVLALVGGHTATDPVAVLLAPGPDLISAAQQVRRRVSELLAAQAAQFPQWVASYTRQGVLT